MEAARAVDEPIKAPPKPTSWVCPCCIRSFEAIEDFQKHLEARRAVIEKAQARPEQHARFARTESVE